MDMIYHICRKEDWEKSAENKYTPDSLVSEGFIHCSTIHQVQRVLNTFYMNQNDLLLLEINRNLLSSSLHWEPGADKADELFPHIYGSLNKDAVHRVIDINKDSLEKLISSMR